MNVRATVAARWRVCVCVWGGAADEWRATLTHPDAFPPAPVPPSRAMALTDNT